jgi:hypothetical protein
LQGKFAKAGSRMLRWYFTKRTRALVGHGSRISKSGENSSHLQTFYFCHSPAQFEKLVGFERFISRVHGAKLLLIAIRVARVTFHLYVSLFPLPDLHMLLSLAHQTLNSSSTFTNTIGHQIQTGRTSMLELFHRNLHVLVDG